MFKLDFLDERMDFAPFAPLRELTLARMVTTYLLTQRRKDRERRDAIRASLNRVRLDWHFV